jgi:hypothetical protein
LESEEQPDNPDIDLKIPNNIKFPYQRYIQTDLAYYTIVDAEVRHTLNETERQIILRFLKRRRIKFELLHN